MTTKRVLVTGAGGFVGRHLVELVARTPGLEPLGTFHHPPTFSNDGGLPEAARYVGDLTDQRFAEDVVRDSRPDWVAHLAAQPSPADSWRDPGGTLTTNLLSQLYVLEAAARYAPSARVLVVGSSEEYGRTTEETVVATESSPLLPENPYATSKVAQDYLGLQYFLGKSVDVVRVRPFNLFGPGQSDRFAISSFARQIAEGELGLRPASIAVGNLAARRDYTDVRDAVRAYVAVLARAPAGEVYNVGGGGVRAVGEILSALVGQAKVPFAVEVDPARFRPSNLGVIAPDISRLRAVTGWEPTVAFDQTIADILGDWRGRLGAGSEGSPA